MMKEGFQQKPLLQLRTGSTPKLIETNNGEKYTILQNFLLNGASLYTDKQQVK